MSEFQDSSEIHKVAFDKKGIPEIHITSSVYENGNFINEVQKKKKDLYPHQSFLTKMKNLLPHALLVADIKITTIDENYLQQRKVHNDTNLRSYFCVGFEVKSSDDKETVTLTIRKKSSTNNPEFKVGPIPIKGKKADYPFSGLLSEEVDAVKEEAQEYLDGKNFNTDQVNLDLKDKSEDESEF